MNLRRRISRREFLKQGMWLAAAAVAASVPGLAEVVASGRKRGPNGTLRLGVVGVKGRGNAHVDEWTRMKDVQVAALCDIDENVIGETMTMAEKGSGKKPDYYKDARKLVEDKSIDAISIATCNHTHTLIALWALQAGKHVYVEKPLSHTVAEGAALAAAAKATGLVVQHGTQSRSSTGLQQMIASLRAGELGKLTAVRALCYKRRTSIGKTPDAPVPKGVDYDAWLGPAPVRPFSRNRFHYNWHWNWDYGNGDIGNQGVHEMDRARWGLGVTGHPKEILSIGGRVGYEDDGETPNTMTTLFDWGGVPLVFEVRGLDTEAYRGAKIGVIFDCEGGSIVNPSYESATAFDKAGKQIRTFGGGGNHFRNFIEAVQANNPGAVNAPPAEGHLSASLCHLANVSYRTGSPSALGATESPFRNEIADDGFRRMRDHLTAQGVSLKDHFLLGQRLAFDGARESVTGSKDANELLTREYRKPYVLPQIG